MITNQDKKIIAKLFRKTKVETDRIIKKPGSVVPDTHTMRNVMAMQNAMRTCMEIMLNETIPYDEELLVEMGIRLAAYAVSAAPIEIQERMAQRISVALPPSVALRQKSRIGIQSEWITDGVVHPNMPTKNNTQ